MILFSDYVKITASTQYPLLSVVGQIFDNIPEVIKVYTNRGIYDCNYVGTNWVWTGNSNDGFSSIIIDITTVGNRQILYLKINGDYEGSLTVIDPTDEGQIANSVIPLLPQFSNYPDFVNDSYTDIYNNLLILRAELYGLLKALQDLNTQELLKNALDSIQYTMPNLNVYDPIYAHSVVYTPFKLTVNELEKWNADTYSYPTLSEKVPFDFIAQNVLNLSPFIMGEVPEPSVPESEEHYFIISDEPL